MRGLALILLCTGIIFPLSGAIKLSQPSIIVDSPTILSQEYYMFSNETSPSAKNAAKSSVFISVTYNISKAIDSLYGRGVVEALIVSDAEYEQIGGLDNGVKVMCCDGRAFDNNVCSIYNELILSPAVKETTVHDRQEFTGKPTSIHLEKTIETEGKYYVVVAICDASSRNILINAQTEVKHPYGYYPARSYGYIPFCYGMVVFYSFLLLGWLLICKLNQHEIMNIHVLIGFLILANVLTYIIQCFDNFFFNRLGNYVYGFKFISVVFLCLSRAYARMVVIAIAMGLGITVTTLGVAKYGIYTFGGLYFFFTLRDYLDAAFSVSYVPDLWNTIPSTILDAVLYFWVFLSLLDNITLLYNKNQTSKMAIFQNFRIIATACIIVATLYNLYFSQLINATLVKRFWKWEWFYNEGVWDVFYASLVLTICYLWCPSDRSKAYAQHIQISSDEKKSDEYEMEEDPLQYAEGEEEIQVLALDAKNNYEMKPMKIGL